MNLSRFDAAPLIAFTAAKETDYALHGRVLRSNIPGVGLKRTGEFRQNAVRIALTIRFAIARQHMHGMRERGESRWPMTFAWVADAEQVDHCASAARQCRFTCTKTNPN